jgi:hypothetical protein
MLFHYLLSSQPGWVRERLLGTATSVPVRLCQRHTFNLSRQSKFSVDPQIKSRSFLSRQNFIMAAVPQTLTDIEGAEEKINLRAKNVPWYDPKLKKLGASARELLENYSKIPPAEVESHIYKIVCLFLRPIRKVMLNRTDSVMKPGMSFRTHALGAFDSSTCEFLFLIPSKMQILIVSQSHQSISRLPSSPSALEIR